MYYFLNISVYDANDGTNLDVGDVLSFAQCLGIQHHRVETHHDIDETTLIMQCRSNVPTRYERMKVYALADYLQQDCIAMCSEFARGRMIGPRANEWPAFNPSMFHFPSYNGERESMLGLYPICIESIKDSNACHVHSMKLGLYGVTVSGYETAKNMALHIRCMLAADKPIDMIKAYYFGENQQWAN